MLRLLCDLITVRQLAQSIDWVCWLCIYAPVLCLLLLQNPPWAQSASYSAALRESRNPTALQLTGRGDPTGRGRGFSYMREEVKKAKEDAAAVKAKDDGTVQGEDLKLHWVNEYVPA